MTLAPKRVWTRRIAFTAGLLLAVVGVWNLQVTNGSEPLGASITVEAASTGELLLNPTGTFLSGRHLTAGELAEGRVRLRNQTGRTLAVRVRTAAESRDLDDTLAVRLEAGRRPLFGGRLGELRVWTKRAFVVEVGEAVDLRMVVSVPATGGYEGRTAEARLELESRPLENRS